MTPLSRRLGACLLVGAGLGIAMPAGLALADREPPRAPITIEHPVFSLSDNRLLAHVHRGGGLVAIAGSAGFVKYVNFGKPNLPWKLGEKKDGHRVALSDNYARLVLPVDTKEAAAAQKLYIRASSSTARNLEVQIAGKKVAQVDVPAGWSTIAVPLPAGAVKPGENEFLLAWGKKGDSPAVEWVQLGGDAPPDGAPSYYDVAKDAVVIPGNGSLTWYVMVPASGSLVGEVSAGCTVTARAHGHEGKAIEGPLPLDLSPLAGKIVRLDLAASGCPQAEVAHGALTMPGPAPVETKAKRPKNVVFWIMDSLRADRIRPFFPGARPEVPNWEQLAKEATIFKNTYVQGNESRASHASIWTSLYVVNHKMIHDHDILDPKWMTIGGAMKAAGFYTSGVSANGWIIAKWGFGVGWDAYRNHIHQDGGTRGEDVWKYAALSIKDHLAKPWFLYMGFVDTHVTWRAHEPWIDKYDTNYTGPYKKALSDPELDKIAAGSVKVGDRDRERIKALYDSDVSYQDDLIGKVRAQLAEWKAADDTMIIITGDHGDEFWEDGRIGHGGSLHETLIHVPLIIYYPPLFPPDTVVEEGAEDIDILPTILDAIGQPIGPDMQGESLIGLAQGVGRGYPRPSISSQYEDAHAMRLGGWKILVRSSGQPHVYDAVNDHLEKTDLADTRPLERRFLTDSMSTFLIFQKQWKKSRWGVASNQSAQFPLDVDK